MYLPSCCKAHPSAPAACPGREVFTCPDMAPLSASPQAPSWHPWWCRPMDPGLSGLWWLNFFFIFNHILNVQRSPSFAIRYVNNLIKLVMLLLLSTGVLANFVDATCMWTGVCNVFAMTICLCKVAELVSSGRTSTLVLVSTLRQLYKL